MNHFFNSYFDIITNSKLCVLASIFLALLSNSSSETGYSNRPEALPIFRDMVIINEYGGEESIWPTLDHEPGSSMAPNGISAASYLTITALFQEVPVLIPAALWNNLHSHATIFRDFSQESDRFLQKKYGKTVRFHDPEERKLFKQACHYNLTVYNAINEHIQNTKNPDDLAQKIWHDPRFDKSSVPSKVLNQLTNYQFVDEMGTYLMCAVLPLKKYHCYTVTIPEHPEYPYILFLPSTLLHQALNDSNDSKDSNANQARDRFLGLNISSCTPIQLTGKIPHNKKFYGYRTLLPELFNTLFKKRNEYTREQVQEIPSWCFYMMGHGIYSHKAHEQIEKEQGVIQYLQKLFKRHKKNSKNQAQTVSCQEKIEHHRQKIAQLEKNNILLGTSLESFTQLLLFLEKELSTKFLFYSSCCAGGNHSIKPFFIQEPGQEKPTALRFSYPIITDTLIEAPSMTAIPLLRLRFYHDGAINKPITCLPQMDLTHKKFTVHSLYDFTNFFNDAHKSTYTADTVLDFLATLCHFYRPDYQETGSAEEWNNTPLIRPAGEDKFYTVFTSEQQTCLKPSNNTSISQQISPNTCFLGITTEQIPYSLRIAHKVPPACVSFIPGQSCHIFSEIQAPHLTLDQIINSLVPHPRLCVPKLFSIEKLSCKSSHKNLYNIVLVHEAWNEFETTPPTTIHFRTNLADKNWYTTSWPAGTQAPELLELRAKKTNKGPGDREQLISKCHSTQEHQALSVITPTELAQALTTGSSYYAKIV